MARDYDKHRDYQRDWKRRNRQQAVADAGGCCKVCDSQLFLEFHHIDPTKKINHRVWSWSAARRAIELRKCILLCRTCHKRLHAVWSRIYTHQYTVQFFIYIWSPAAYNVATPTTTNLREQ